MCRSSIISNGKSHGQPRYAMLAIFYHLLELTIIFLPDTERAKILDWLAEATHGKNHQDAKRGRTVGTCGWLSKRPEFLEWQTTNVSNILWLHGDRKIHDLYPNMMLSELTDLFVSSWCRKDETHVSTSLNPSLSFFLEAPN